MYSVPTAADLQDSGWFVLAGKKPEV